MQRTARAPLASLPVKDAGITTRVRIELDDRAKGRAATVDRLDSLEVGVRQLSRRVATGPQPFLELGDRGLLDGNDRLVLRRRLRRGDSGERHDEHERARHLRRIMCYQSPSYPASLVS